MNTIENIVLAIRNQHPDKEVKVLSMQDRNNKKEALVFVELNFAPAVPVSERMIKGTVFVIYWQDGNYSVVCLLDVIRFPFSKISAALTYPSHGMAPDDFQRWWKVQFPNVNPDTEMALYIYQKKSAAHD